MTKDRTATEQNTVTQLVKAVAARRHRLVVPTDDSDPSLARARHAALELSRRFDLDAVLYDRSGERWTEHPHPKGPLRVEEVDGGRRPHLVQQLRDFEVAGVGASAYLATVPALTAMIDVLQELDIDVIVLPAELDEPRLMDRLQVGGSPAEMIRRIADLQLDVDPVIFVVDDDGVIDVAPGQDLGACSPR
jgi:nucleotide-binding universal stress UspA family protein